MIVPLGAREPGVEVRGGPQAVAGVALSAAGAVEREDRVPVLGSWRAKMDAGRHGVAAISGTWSEGRKGTRGMTPADSGPIMEGNRPSGRSVVIQDPAEAVESLTIEEFARLPEEGEYRSELVRGRIVRDQRPGARHGWLAGRLYVALDAWARESANGIAAIETGFVLGDDPHPTVRGPDVAFIAAGRLGPEGIPTGFWRFAPDLAIEVVSPTDRASEVHAKVLDYLDAGTRSVWVVDPDSESVTMYRSRRDVRVLAAGDRLEDAEVLPGFGLAIAELFGPLR